MKKSYGSPIVGTTMQARRSAAVGATASASRTGVGGKIDAKVATRQAFLNIAGGTKINVYVRLRPFTAAEQQSEPPGSTPKVVALEDGVRLSLYERREVEMFQFERVFTAQSSQEEVFTAVMGSQVEAAVSGVSSCVFAYGQTGSGKTHTAFGDLASPAGYGLIPRAAAALFAGLEAKWGAGARELGDRLGLPQGRPTTRPWVRLSILECYNEELTDLLFPTGAPRAAGGSWGADAGEARVVPFASAIGVIRAEQAEAARLAAIAERELAKDARRGTAPGAALQGEGSGSSGGGGGGGGAAQLAPTALSVVDHPTRGTLVLHQTQVEVGSPEEVVELLRVCEARSHWAETALNKVSNRAHRVITFTTGVTTVTSSSSSSSSAEGEGGSSSSELLADLRIVDLAGSEDTNRSLAVGASKVEASHINKSLLALGRVIVALASGAGHIPYRESKLTRLLSEALGGVCATTFVCCASPAGVNLGETASTLRYAKRASQALNIASLPKGQQDEYLIAALMRRLEGAEADTAERVRAVSEAAAAASAAAQAARAEAAHLSEALAAATAAAARARAQAAATAAALSITALRAERLEGQVSELGAALGGARREAAGLLADRGALVSSLAGVRASRDVLLQGAAAHSAALQAAAQGVLGALGGAVSEGAALAAQLQRRRALSAANARALDAFTEASAGGLGEAVELAGEVRGALGQWCAGSCEGLSQLAGERSSQAAAAASDVRRLVRGVLEVLGSLGDSVGAAEAEARERSLKCREEGRAGSEAVSGLLGALKSALEAGLGGLRGSAGQLEEALSAWSSRSGRALEALGAAQEAWLGRLGGECSALAAGLAGAAGAAEAAGEAAGAASEAARAEAAALAARAGERLVSEVHSALARAVGELVSTLGASASRQAAELRAGGSAATHEAVLALRRGAAGLAACAAGAEAQGRVAALDLAELRRMQGGGAGGCSGLLAGLKGALDALEREVGARCREGLARVEGSAAALAEGLLAGDSAAGAHAASVAATVASASGSAGGALEAVAAGLLSGAASGAAACAALRASAADAQQAAQGLLDAQLAALQGVVAGGAAFASSGYVREGGEEGVGFTARQLPLGFPALPAPEALLGGAPEGQALLAVWAREEAVRRGERLPGRGLDYPGEQPVLPLAGAAEAGGGGGQGQQQWPQPQRQRQ